MEIKENKNYYDAAMRQTNGDSLCLSTYQYLKKNEEWVGRYEDFLKGRRSLPLLYDPFFKKIFNPVERRDRLSELVSCLLGQKVTVLEVFPNEDSQFLGVMIIMDMVVLMADGSIANIEIQKISYDFPAERISCYSADLVLRQYKMITGKSDNSINGSSKPSYKDMRKVHTIILFEDSNKSLISEVDKALYFHVGKTKFNTGIKIELLQDFVLVSLDTFKKYRYSDIKEGRTEITDYDYDSSQYNDELVSEKMKRDRLKFLSLFVAETPQEIDKLVETFPDLESVRQDINEYLERPGEVLSMFSEALRILDRNTAELMVDRMKDEIVDLQEQNDELTGRIDELEEQTYGLKAEKEELIVHTDKLEAENNALKVSSDQKDAEIARLKKLLEEQNK